MLTAPQHGWEWEEVAAAGHAGDGVGASKDTDGQ